jgi:hypothetical protein
MVCVWNPFQWVHVLVWTSSCWNILILILFEKLNMKIWGFLVVNEFKEGS